MSRPKALVFGHSHMGALLTAFERAAANGQSSVDLVSYQFLRDERPHIVNIDGKWRYHPECQSELREMIRTVAPSIIVSMLQGEGPALAGLAMPARPFEFYFPGEQHELERSHEIVPFDLLLEACRYEHRLISNLLDEVVPFGVPAVALSPPPPVGDADFIFAAAPKGTAFANNMRERGLPPLAWRCRIWQLHVLAYRTIYEQHGIMFVNPPSEACDTKGCLRQPFWSDVFHANAEYGRLLLRQIESHVTGAA